MQDYLYAILIGYFCGSIPTAYLIGKLVYRLDIFEYGSKNMGATNVYRVLGKAPFAFTLAIDVLKGMLAVILTAKVLERNPLALFAAGAAALAGHTLSFWVRFRGGKGVASGLGVFIALAPKATLTTLLVFLTVLVISKMVSLGSIIAAAALPFLIYGFQEGGPVYYPYLTGFSAIIAAFIIFKHKTNIRRILSGEELALGQQKKDAAADESTSETVEEPGEDR